MNKHVGDEKLHASEKEFVNMEGNIMCDTGLFYMKTELCPTGGRNNILRFKKSGLMVMLLLLMMNPTVLLKRDVMLLKTGSVRMYPMMISDILQVETSSDDSKLFNGGGNVPLPVPVDRTEGVAKEVGDQDDDKIQVRATEGNAPVDESGGAVLVHTDVRAVLTVNDGSGAVPVPVDSEGGTVHIQARDADSGTGDVHVHAHIDEGGGTVQVTERRAVTKYDGGGSVYDGVFDEHDQVDDEAKILMAKHDWFVHATADEEVAVAKHSIAGGEGAVNAPVEKKVDMTKVVEDQGDVQVHYGGAVKDEEGAYVIKTNTIRDGINVQVDDGAELTKIVGTTEGLHTMEKILMTDQDRFDHATIDEEITVAKEEFEGVQVTVEIEHELDNVNEGGGYIPTPDDKEAGKLGILMSEQECFGHERGGGIAKCTRLLSCAFMLVVNAGKLCPRGRRQAHLPAATCSDNTWIVLSK
jgi:hypothetical protein